MDEDDDDVQKVVFSEYVPFQDKSCAKQIRFPQRTTEWWFPNVIHKEQKVSVPGSKASVGISFQTFHLFQSPISLHQSTNHEPAPPTMLKNRHGKNAKKMQNILHSVQVVKFFRPIQSKSPNQSKVQITILWADYQNHKDRSFLSVRLKGWRFPELTNTSWRALQFVDICLCSASTRRRGTLWTLFLFPSSIIHFFFPSPGLYTPLMLTKSGFSLFSCHLTAL